jgi:hypothetical protein
MHGGAGHHGGELCGEIKWFISQQTGNRERERERDRKGPGRHKIGPSKALPVTYFPQLGPTSYCPPPPNNAIKL